MESKKISIIIPVRNEEKYISRCLESIVLSDYPNDQIEILVINSMSNDNSVNIVKEYMKKFDFIYLYDNVHIYTPFAFNIGIKEAIGDYIFIVSAHAKYDNSYFSTLIHHAVRLNADSVGAVSKTDVLNKNPKSNSIKAVLSHKLGVGNAHFRVGSDSVIEVDAISGCYDKRVFERYGLYNEKLIRNQDIELNKRIKNRGGRLYLIPYTTYTYYARDNFEALAKNSYSNGYWNMLTVYYTNTFRSLSLRHFIPLLFVLSLLLPIFLIPFVSQFIWIIFMSLGSYLALVIIISSKLKDSSNTIGYLIISFLTLHLSYGWGSIMGIFSVINKYLKGEP